METKIRNSKIKQAVVILAAAALFGGVGIGAANAQAPSGQGRQNGPGPNGPDGGGRGAMVCGTTDYTEVAAKALGMTSAALRQALHSGKTLDQIATSQNVEIKTVEDALLAARDADLQTAISAGLVTQPNSTAQTPVAPTPSPNQKAQGQGKRFLQVPERNVIHPYVVMANASGISCPDLVKAVRGGQTVAQVATSKSVTAQTVIDALEAAEKAALAEDVTEGLITQAQADTALTAYTKQATTLVNNTSQAGDRQGPDGQRQGNQRGGGQSGQPGNENGGGNGGPGQGGPQNGPQGNLPGGNS